MSNEFKPEIIVHNGEGLTLTVRPDEKVFSGCKDDVDYEFKFNNMDIDVNNQVVWKNSQIGRDEISDDIFMRSRPPVLVLPTDGSDNWVGEIEYETNLSKYVLDSSTIKLQVSTNSNFTSPLERDVSTISTNYKIAPRDLITKFNFGTTVFVRLVTTLPNTNVTSSYPNRVIIYDSFTASIDLLPLTNGAWIGDVNFTLNIIDDFVDDRVVAIEVSDNINFTDAYSESVTDKNHHKLQYDKIIEKFGFGINLFIRVKLTILNKTVYSQTENINIQQLQLDLTKPANSETDWDGECYINTNLTDEQKTIVDSMVIEVSKQRDFSSIEITTSDITSVSQYTIPVDQIVNIGIGVDVYVRIKMVINSRTYYSSINLANTYSRVTLTINSLTTDSGMWTGGVNYTINTLSQIKNAGTLYLEVHRSSSFVYNSYLLRVYPNANSSSYTIPFADLANKYGLDSETENTVVYVRLYFSLPNGKSFTSSVRSVKLYNGSSISILSPLPSVKEWDGNVTISKNDNSVTNSLFTYKVKAGTGNSWVENSISGNTGSVVMDDIFNAVGIKCQLEIKILTMFNSKTLRESKITINMDYFSSIYYTSRFSDSCWAGFTGYRGGCDVTIETTFVYNSIIKNYIAKFKHKISAPGYFYLSDPVYGRFFILYQDVNGYCSTGAYVGNKYFTENVYVYIDLKEGRIQSKPGTIKNLPPTGGNGN